MSSITIVLADDHQVVTHSLKTYLESFSDLSVTSR
jgi:DNA-binding NarL/FixJ family response regulator